MPPKTKSQAQREAEIDAAKNPLGTNQPKKEKLSSAHIQFMVQKDILDPRAFVKGLKKEALDWMESHGYPPFLKVEQIVQIPKRLQKGKEFAVSPMFDPAMIEECCQNGFFPMTVGFGKELRMFAAKCHVDRAVTVFRPPSNTKDLNIGETDPAQARGLFRAAGGGTKKKVKNFRMLVNQDWTFEPCCRMIYEQHGEDWMSAPLRQCFYHIFRRPDQYKTKIHVFAIVREKKQKEKPEEEEPSVSEKEKNFEIISCELGYTVGTIYTSLTGAYIEPGAGSIQLNAMGLLLEQLGYKVWDLGMQMKYKQEQLHSVEWSRSRWLKTVAEERRNSVGDFALESLNSQNELRLTSSASAAGGGGTSTTNTSIRSFSLVDIDCSILWYRAEEIKKDPNSASSRKKEEKLARIKAAKEAVAAGQPVPEKPKYDPEQVEKTEKEGAKKKGDLGKSEPTPPVVVDVYSPFLRSLFT